MAGIGAELVKIDGSMLEGGGQILRYSAALSAITGRALQVDSVRAKRSRPGLQPQHLTGLRLVEAICGGQLTGGEVGSSCITLRPGLPRAGSYTADTRTAGSCSLMVQASLPVCMFALPPAEVPAQDKGSRRRSGGGTDGGPKASAATTDASGRAVTQLELRGGTDADMAPPAAYLTHVLLPLLGRAFGELVVGAEVQLERRGFYPRGGGVLRVHVPALPPGTPLPPLDLATRGNLSRVVILAFSAGRVPATVPKRMAAAAEAAVRRTLRGLGPAGRGVPVEVEAVVEPPERAFGDGCGILIYADTDTGCRLGASSKGERGVPAEQVGERAAEELAEALTSGTCVDQWMQDQLIIWMALAGGTSRVRCSEPTLHTRTAMVVTEALLPGVKFRLHRPQQLLPAGGSSKDFGSGGASQGTGVAGGGGGGAGEGGGGGLWLIECDGCGWTVGQRAPDACRLSKSGTGQD